MEANLVVVGGKAKKAKVALKVPTLIGRSKEAGLTIGHPMISRQHCEIFESDGLLMVRDLGSLNGTVVDGRRVKESPLPPDAEFSVGPLTFRVEYTYDGDLTNVPATVFAEPQTAAAPTPKTPANDEDVFDLKADETPLPAASPTITSAKPAATDSSSFEEILAQSSNGAAGAGKSAEDDAEEEDDIDFFAMIDEETSEPAPQPKAAEVAPKQAKPAAAAQPAPAKKATASADQKAKPTKESAVAAKEKPTKPVPATKKQPSKEAAAQPKPAPVDDPSELPDDLFDDLLKGLD